ncbi:hypothetical protein [Sphingomonas sp. PvP056]
MTIDRSVAGAPRLHPRGMVPWGSSVRVDAEWLVEVRVIRRGFR